jgi:hypothetical protein
MLYEIAGHLFNLKNVACIFPASPATYGSPPMLKVLTTGGEVNLSLNATTAQDDESKFRAAMAKALADA